MKKIIWKRRWIIWIYSSFSYCSNALWLILDLLPHFLRVLLFRIIFKHFGHDCLLDYRCYVRYPWRVSVGNNVAINRGCELYSSMKTDNGLITIEDHATLGPGVVIFSATHDYSSLDLADISERVIIGRYAWIGGKTIILPGVVIGEGAVVGAGSIVTKNIPPFSIAVGNPAKVINTRLIV